jgi:hypothetical protein
MAFIAATLTANMMKELGSLVMLNDRVNDLEAFRGFIDEQLKNGGPAPTLDEALVRWEYENSTEHEREEVRAALGQGLHDVDAGRVRPFEEFDREFRAKYGIPPRA